MSEMFMPIGADAMELLNTYSNAKRGALISAMFAYFMGGEEPAFTGTERHVWPALRRMLDRMRASYEAKREAGSKGGQSRTREVEAEIKQPEAAIKQNEADVKQAQAETKQTQAEINTNTKTNTNTETKTNTNGECEAKRGRFTPPTQEEVKSYCEANGLQVDAARFVDYYQSQGWRVGNQSMCDWQAAVRNWARGEHAPAPAKTQEAQQYSQRTYANSLDPLDELMREYGRL